MGLKIWQNGELVDEAQAKVSVFDHGLLYGDGVFEGIRVYSGNIFEFEAHIDRLYESAKAIRLDIGMDKRPLMDATEETVKANEIEDGYIRLLVTRGVGDLGLNPFVCGKAGVIIIAANIQLYPEEFYETGLKVISANAVRTHPLTLPPQVKSLNYLNNILAKIEAIDHGVGEVVMYNPQGYVAEASGDNIFIIRKGELFTPPIQAGALDGITRQVVMKLARESGYTVTERNLTKFDLYIADECFLTGTAAEVIGVVEIDGRIVGDGKPGAVTKELRKKFFEYARS
ncbi:Branched-chain-amino-acid aminotransferase [Anaerohalosphaera lusitana]|uniref:Branched-chain-amino-acid aminotransferase n=1 Tax=Anaerohalosphaera lusitana TaxID=1936003 RepID=A0A1U9NR15_9BACT|nr:branched-chain-amino-acid transaminase [Anaerohalosphaera lusitana]AQT70265.1 Branched-chain-amino-acid aminotransferase [Anaerohalosphaera lusitana]